MDPIRHIRDRDEVVEASDQAIEKLRQLSKTVQTSCRPPPGPYGFFGHNAHAIKRLRAVRTIAKRLYEGRLALLRADLVEHHFRPKNWPAGTPYPKEFGEISRSVQEIDEALELDFETLLIFSSAALDDVAKMVAFVLHVPKPARFSFSNLVRKLKEGGMPVELGALTPNIVWLDNFLRTYRNNFVVHRTIPWQVGHTRSIFGMDWKFWSPAMSGWISEQELQEIDDELGVLCDNCGVSRSGNAHEKLVALMNVDAAEPNWQARDRVLEIAKTIGFESPTFQSFSRRLFQAANEILSFLVARAEEEPSTVDLGPPPHR